MNKYKYITLCLVMLSMQSCKKDGIQNPITNTPVNSAKEFITQTIFVEPWGAADANTELTGLAYDSLNDQIFWTKCRWQWNNEIMRYNLTSGNYDYVYSYTSQMDYGLRMLGTNLWLVRTYDSTLVKFSSLASYPITNEQTIIPRGAYPAFNNINDIALVSGSLFIIPGQMVDIPTYHGIQRLSAPGYSNVQRVTPELWAPVSYTNFRSIVSVGSNLVIATGDSGSIEVRDTSGILLQRQSGYGNTYLQTDTRNRIYSMITFPEPVRIIRWSSDLSAKEEFNIRTSPSLYGAQRVLFVLREKKKDSVDVIMTPFLETSKPVFQMATIPK